MTKHKENQYDAAAELVQASGCPGRQVVPLADAGLDNVGLGLSVRAVSDRFGPLWCGKKTYRF